MPLVFISIHRRVVEGRGGSSHLKRFKDFLNFFYPALRREQSRPIKNGDPRKVPPSNVLNPQRTFDLTEAEMKKKQKTGALHKSQHSQLAARLASDERRWNASVDCRAFAS